MICMKSSTQQGLSMEIRYTACILLLCLGMMRPVFTTDTYQLKQPIIERLSNTRDCISELPATPWRNTLKQAWYTYTQEIEESLPTQDQETLYETGYDVKVQQKALSIAFATPVHCMRGGIKKHIIYPIDTTWKAMCIRASRPFWHPQSIRSRQLAKLSTVMYNLDNMISFMHSSAFYEYQPYARGTSHDIGQTRDTLKCLRNTLLEEITPQPMPETQNVLDEYRENAIAMLDERLTPQDINQKYTDIIQRCDTLTQDIRDEIRSSDKRDALRHIDFQRITIPSSPQ